MAAGADHQPQAELLVVVGHRIVNDVSLLVGAARTLDEIPLRDTDRAVLVDIIDRRTRQLEGTHALVSSLQHDGLRRLSSAIKDEAQRTAAAVKANDPMGRVHTVPRLAWLLDQCVLLVLELMQGGSGRLTADQARSMRQ